jgi:hypothetical protein
VSSAEMSISSKKLRYLLAQMPLGKALVDKWGLYIEEEDSCVYHKSQFPDALIVFRVASTDGTPALIPGTEGALFIGSIGSAYNHATLERLGITHIVCAADKARLAPQFTSLRVSITDKVDCDIIPYFKLTTSFINAARARGGRILVHCFQGISRASTLCAAYLLLAGVQTTVEDCLEAIRSVRLTAAPNTGFLRALATLEASLRVSGGNLSSFAELHGVVSDAACKGQC